MIHLITGLEIECEVKPDLSKNIMRGSYHHPHWLTDDWSSQSDSSMSPNKWAYSSCYEFVSRPFAACEMKHLLLEFRALFNDSSFTDSIHFNETCGHHIHFSGTEVPDDYNGPIVLPTTEMMNCQCNLCAQGQRWSIEFGGRAFYVHGTKMYPRISMEAVKVVRAVVGNALPKRAMTLYFRHHANRLTEETNRPRNRKYSEIRWFNKSHGEFRSFNLNGIRTWKGLQEQYRNALEALKEKFFTTPPDEMHNIPATDYYDSCEHDPDQETHRISINREPVVHRRTVSTDRYPPNFAFIHQGRCRDYDDPNLAFSRFEIGTDDLEHIWDNTLSYRQRSGISYYKWRNTMLQRSERGQYEDLKQVRADALKVANIMYHKGRNPEGCGNSDCETCNPPPVERPRVYPWMRPSSSTVFTPTPQVNVTWDDIVDLDPES